MFQVVMCHIGMTEAVERHIVGQLDSLANLVVGLVGASGVAAGERIGGGTADIAVFMPDRIKFLFDFTFCRF